MLHMFHRAIELIRMVTCMQDLKVCIIVSVYYFLFTSLAKEVMFLVALVCLFVCGQHYSKSCERIGMKFYGGVLGSAMKTCLNGGDLGILRWVNEQKNTIIVVAYPDRGAGNDSKLFIFFFFIFIYLFILFSIIIIIIIIIFLGGVVFHHQGLTFLQWAIWE